MPYKVFPLTIASGATGSNKVFVGAHEHIQVVLSAMTGYNVGTGNAALDVRGGLSATDTHVTLLSCTVTTMTIKGIYPMPHRGPGYLSVGFGTAVTGTSANVVDLVVYTSNNADS